MALARPMHKVRGEEARQAADELGQRFAHEGFGVISLELFEATARDARVLHTGRRGLQDEGVGVFGPVLRAQFVAPGPSAMVVPEQAFFGIGGGDQELFGPRELELGVGDGTLDFVVWVGRLGRAIPEAHLVANHDWHREAAARFDGGGFGQDGEAVLEFDLVAGRRDQLLGQQRDALGHQGDGDHVGLRSGEVLRNVGHDHILARHYVRHVPPEEDFVEGREGRDVGRLATASAQDAHEDIVFLGRVGDGRDLQRVAEGIDAARPLQDGPRLLLSIAELRPRPGSDAPRAGKA